MKCRKCRQLTNEKKPDHMAIHWYETHGVPFELQQSEPDRFPWIKFANAENLKTLWEQHKNTGKLSAKKFNL